MWRVPKNIMIMIVIVIIGLSSSAGKETKRKEK